MTQSRWECCSTTSESRKVVNYGVKDNCQVEKFYEAARWLRINYGIDITVIEEP